MLFIRISKSLFIFRAERATARADVCRTTSSEATRYNRTRIESFRLFSVRWSALILFISQRFLGDIFNALIIVKEIHMHVH